MRRTTTPVVVVGIFFVVGVLLLIWFSLRVQGSAARADKNIYYAEFEKVAGLQEGAPVTLAGVEVGTVTSLRYDDGRRKVVIELAVSKEHKVRRGDRVAVQMRSLLGQYFVNIEPGPVSQPEVEPGSTLPSRETADLGDLLASLSSASGKAGGMFGTLQDNLTSISSVIEENRANLRRATEALADVAPQLESIATSLSLAAASFAEIGRSLSEGKGTLGRLLKDETLYYNASDTAENLKAITSDVRQGKGTLGQLLKDERLHGEIQETFESFRTAANEIADLLQKNHEDLQKTIASLGKVSDNLAVITDKVRKGDGTLGLLVNDRTLYDDIRSAVDQIRRTFEQGEEQSVARTFIGILLGAAQ